jgi:hypothetical protein
LHNEWLPRVQAGNHIFVRDQFPRLINAALRAAPFARYLDSVPTKLIVGRVAQVALAAGTDVAAQAAGSPVGAVGLGAGVATELAARAFGPQTKQALDLAVFYQRARNL